MKVCRVRLVLGVVSLVAAVLSVAGGSSHARRQVAVIHVTRPNSVRPSAAITPTLIRMNQPPGLSTGRETLPTPLSAPRVLPRHHGLPGWFRRRHMALPQTPLA